MAANKGYKVPMTVVTQDDRDKYPVVKTNDIAGGLHSVETISEMLSIPFLRRRLGMQCYVSSLDKTYRLISHTDNADITIISNWEEIKKAVDAADVQNMLPNMEDYVKKSDIAIPSDGQDGQDGGTPTLPDFSKFATKDEVQNVQNQLPDLSEYVKKSDISIPSDGQDGQDGGTPTLPDFTQFAKKSEVAVVDNKAETNKTNLANHIIYTQEELDKLQWQQKEVTVEASEVPKEITINIKNPNSKYKYPPVEVLKYEQLPSAITETVTLADFVASESSKYETNDKVVFDGNLHISPDVDIKMSDPALFTTGMYVSISDPISYDRIQNAASITIE